MPTVTLQSDTDLHGFRQAARALVAADVPPDQVHWRVQDEAAGMASATSGDLFADPAAHALPTVNTSAAALRVPAWYGDLVDRAGRHIQAQRFGLLYQVLWRLQHEPGLRHDPLDPDRQRLAHLAREVGRSQHKMKAFVRFRPVQEVVDAAAGLTQTVHVAWFEPEHHIVEAVAPFFARRFTAMRWAILTPRCSVCWDGQRLQTGPGTLKQDAPGPDAGEALWLTYYQHIFNPARLKLKMMQKEMPRKYWKNLPEAALISSLTDASPERHWRMLTGKRPEDIDVFDLPQGLPQSQN